MRGIFSLSLAHKVFKPNALYLRHDPEKGNVDSALVVWPHPIELTGPS